MTGAERAKISRIKAKHAEGKAISPEEMAYLTSRGHTLDIRPVGRPAGPAQSISMDASTGPGQGLSASPTVTDGAEVWDRIVDATADDDDGDDDDDDDDGPGDESASPRTESPGVAGKPEVQGGTPYAGGPPAIPSMSVEVSRGTAASAFLLMQSGWSLLGDREPAACEPSDEEMRLLSKVFASYAERYGWTKELDDAILVGTVLLVYNARCMRAPKKKDKAKLPAGKP